MCVTGLARATRLPPDMASGSPGSAWDSGTSSGLCRERAAAVPCSRNGAGSRQRDTQRRMMTSKKSFPNEMDLTSPWVGRPLAQSPASSELHCDLCQKEFRSAATLASHLQSTKHRKRESEARRQSTSPSKPVAVGVDEEHAAMALRSPARAAQALYDLGMAHGRAGRAADCIRCLERCVTLLPPLQEPAALARVLIECRARCTVARALWESPSAAAQAHEHVRAAVALLHAQGARVPECAPLAPWSEVQLAVREWRAHVRADAHDTVASVCGEFGCRLSASEASLEAAVLLTAGERFHDACAVWAALNLYGHAMECALLGRRFHLLLEMAIVHPNPTLLASERVLSQLPPPLAAVARHVVQWDSFGLQVLALDTTLTSEVRHLARLGLETINKVPC